MPGTRKLGRTTAHRNAMLRGMVTYLLENGKIETTLTRAKEVRALAEKMITLGKSNTLAAYRQALAYITKEEVAKKLFDTIAKYPKICKQFHLPFQSGNDRVLKVMNRRYTSAQYLELVDYGRSLMPDLVLTSDVIVGFPGETEEEFEETISLIEQVHYDSLFTFIFSPRPGTPAAKMEDPTPKEEKSRRFDRLCDVQNRISVEIHNNYIGKTMRCLVDGKDKDLLTARTEGGRLVRFAGCDSLIGTYQNVKINGATTWSLTGELA